MIGLFALLLGTLPIEGGPPVLLTPKNLGDHPQLAITAEDGRDGTRFQVSIGAKDGEARPEVGAGNLAVCDGERLVCRCQVEARDGPTRALFEFVVAPAYLEKSQFTFTVAMASRERRKELPAGGGGATYQLTLKDFAAAPKTDQGAKKNPRTEDDGERLLKRRGENYVAYWLTRDPPDREDIEYEPVLLLARLPIEQLVDLLRNLEPVRKPPPPEVIEALALTVETYRKDSIWNPDGRPFKPVQQIDAVGAEKRQVVLNGKTYRYEACPLADAVRLLEHPSGTIPLHRLHAPLSGAVQTARALRLLLKVQLASESARPVPGR